MTYLRGTEDHSRYSRMRKCARLLIGALLREWSVCPTFKGVAGRAWWPRDNAQWERYVPEQARLHVVARAFLSSQYTFLPPTLEGGPYAHPACNSLE